MTVRKRIKRIWILLTAEEVFDEHGSLGGRTVVCKGRLGARVGDREGAGVLEGIPVPSLFVMRILREGARRSLRAWLVLT